MNILCLSGSFHSRSRSLAVIDALAALLGGHSVQVPRLGTLPFYCEDLDRDKPPVVQLFLQMVSEADAIICVTPEYNHSIPAVLKNALDWASRPAFQSPLKGKPVTFITQAPSPVGGARAQAHLKLVLDSTLSRIHPAHEMMLAGIERMLDAEGRLVDEQALRRLQRHLEDFLGFVAGQ